MTIYIINYIYYNKFFIYKKDYVKSIILSYLIIIFLLILAKKIAIKIAIKSFPQVIFIFYKKIKNTVKS